MCQDTRYQSNSVLLTLSQRKEESAWNPPSILAETLEKIQNIAEEELKQGESGNKASIQEAQNLIRVRNGPSLILAVSIQPSSLSHLSSHFFRHMGQRARLPPPMMMLRKV